MSIEQRLERLERIMLLQSKNVLNVNDVAIILSVSADRVRHLVSKRLIPHYKQGNRTFFKRSEIEEWQLSDRIPTNAEINSKAATHVAINKF